VFHYYLSHQELLTPYQTPQEFAQHFDPSKDMWTQFTEWVKKDTVNLSGIPEFEKKRVIDRMEAQLARFKWRDSGFYQVMNSKDSVVLKALEELGK